MERAELKKFDLPDCPGVYLFKRGREVLYVGKATSLRDRVRSYFDDDLIATRGPRIVDMVTKATSVAHEPTPTVLEALVREAALIVPPDGRPLVLVSNGSIMRMIRCGNEACDRCV